MLRKYFQHKPGDLSSIPCEIYKKAEGENQLHKVILQPLHMNYGMLTARHNHKHI